MEVSTLSPFKNEKLENRAAFFVGLFSVLDFIHAVAAAVPKCTEFQSEEVPRVLARRVARMAVAGNQQRPYSRAVPRKGED